MRVVEPRHEPTVRFGKGTVGFSYSAFEQHQDRATRLKRGLPPNQVLHSLQGQVVAMDPKPVTVPTHTGAMVETVPLAAGLETCTSITG